MYLKIGVHPGNSSLPLARTVGAEMATVTLNDKAISSVSTPAFVSSINGITQYYYGPITYDGFVLTNLTTTGWNFDNFDGPTNPIGGHLFPSPDALSQVDLNSTGNTDVNLRLQSGAAFTPVSIQLDNELNNPFSTTNVSITFVGQTSAGAMVTKTVQLDNVDGYQLSITHI
jgi:hypothetical protein